MRATLCTAVLCYNAACEPDEALTWPVAEPWVALPVRRQQRTSLQAVLQASTLMALEHPSLLLPPTQSPPTPLLTPHFKVRQPSPPSPSPPLPLH